MKKLSIVVPAYNEADCIAKFVAAVSGLGLGNPLEIVFVDDGSTDETLARIQEAAAKDERIRYVSFSRNFGKEAAMLAGLRHATGELAVTMDADLQHDPAVLKTMLAAIETEGYDCAAACRVTRTGEPGLRSWCAHRFYALMSGFSEVALRDGSMDFRMMTRQVVDAVLSLGECGRFTKGIYEWVGFRTKWIETENVDRAAGSSKWSFRSLFLYSIRGFLAFSTAPLQMASVLGVACCALSLLFLAGVGVRGLCTGNWGGGTALLIFLILFVGGLQLSVLGLIGLYLGGVFREVKRRPVYIVKEAK